MSRSLRIGFVVLMLALTALCVTLGAWQVERLGEKERLIATVDQGLASPPVSIAEATDYRPVSFSGTYVPGSTVLVFTSLADAQGKQSGPGYWVMTAVAIDGGGSVYVNRGFVPQAQGPDFATAAVPVGQQSLTGIARLGENAGAFTPAADPANRIDWIRNPARLASFAGALPQPLSAFFVDLPASVPGALPQGGETVVEFPNNHLGYAITWFGFALITPILLAFWLAHQRKGREPTSGTDAQTGRSDGSST